MSRMKKQQHSWFRFSKKTILHVVLSLFFMGIAFYFIKNNDHSLSFPITDVTVVGARHVNHEDIQRYLHPLVNQGFFSVEVDSIKDRLLQVPWIAEVNVRRIWPSQVWVMITERKPIASWNQTSLLSSNGDLFIPDKENFPTDLPQFVGPDGKQISMMEYYKQLDTLLMPLHFKVTRLELTPTHLWKVTLNNGMKLTVNHKDFLTRFSHFVKVYPKVVGDRASEIDHIDLRYPNGLAVRWKTET